MGKQLNQQAARVIGRLVGKSIDLDWLSDPTREEINQGRRGKEVEGKIRREGDEAVISDGSRQRTLGVSHRWVSWSSMAGASAGRGWSQRG